MRSRDGLRSPQCRVAAWICWWCGVAWRRHFWGGSQRQDTVSMAPLAPSTEAPEGWATRVCGEVGTWAMSGERRAACWCPRRSGHGQSGLSSSAGPPAWDRPVCRVGTGVQARERERENTETALVEVQSGQTKPPTLCCPTPPPILTHPSETKNKNVEKNLCTDPPSRKMGAGMVALPGAHSPQLFYNPSPWLKKHAEAAVGAADPPPPPSRGAQKADSCARLRRQSMLALSGPV